MRRLGLGDNLHYVTHVIVDEVRDAVQSLRVSDQFAQVHERSVESDFLLLELKHLLNKHPTLKVVLMSATINHETFVAYFNGAPLIAIPGRTHPVKEL
jgi:ATP-dependent RNA helicase DHX57